MKLSVSIPEADVAFIDSYSQSTGLPTRSAVIQEAVHALRDQSLADEYEAAWDEWDDGPLWEIVLTDGLDD
ncbi:MAG: ribbon-helix-helix domain-containing protein [Propionibacteriaceae bacterium]|jgi:Arc/MetJ-type ribon-helix-helix transcriptional regulator|nr:ribbon-helix-helix domain-containing protein [Propionibacteriaceae bacterium]